eukprot:366390-Chlamydomonas_euryale.AAC.31
MRHTPHKPHVNLGTWETLHETCSEYQNQVTIPWLWHLAGTFTGWRLRLHHMAESVHAMSHLGMYGRLQRQQVVMCNGLSCGLRTVHEISPLYLAGLQVTGYQEEETAHAPDHVRHLRPLHMPANIILHQHNMASSLLATPFQDGERHVASIDFLNQQRMYVLQERLANCSIKLVGESHRECDRYSILLWQDDVDLTRPAAVHLFSARATVSSYQAFKVFPAVWYRPDASQHI